MALGGHTWWCSEFIPGSVLKGIPPGGAQGTIWGAGDLKPKLVKCKASTLFALLFLQLQEWYLLAMKKP